MCNSRSLSAVPVPLIFLAAFLCLLSISCGNKIEDRWSDEFGGVIDRTNAAMVVPVAALMDLYGCETQENCESSLRTLPRDLGPGVEVLRNEIATLESFTPPAQYQDLHHSYLGALKLRLESFELYIAGVQNNDDTLLEAGDDAFTRAQSQHSDNLSLIIEYAREQKGLSPGEAWVLEFGSVQQGFFQYEREINPALESFFSCETVKACDVALRAIPSTLRPGHDRIAQLLVTLESLDPPVALSSCSEMRDTYAKSYRLRVEAYGLFIKGAEEINYDLLDEAIRTWTQALDVGADELASNQACAQSIK